MKIEGDLLASSKLTSKNQITIPKAVREKLQLDGGDTIVFYLEKNNLIISNKNNCKINVKDEEKQIGVRKVIDNE